MKISEALNGTRPPKSPTLAEGYNEAAHNLLDALRVFGNQITYEAPLLSDTPAEHVREFYAGYWSIRNMIRHYNDVKREVK